MIRLLDRYLLSTFLAALSVFTIALVALFVTVDFAAKLGKFLELKSVNVPAFIGWYYLIRLPMSVDLLIPTVVLFASIFTVIKLARTNEILPIAASGTSLRRMASPFVVSAVLSTFAMAALEEFALTRLSDAISESDGILSSREVSYGVEDYDGTWKLWAREYDHLRKEMKAEVRVTRFDDKALPVEKIVARTCRWNAARLRWVAFEGHAEYPQEIVQEDPKSRPQLRREAIGPEGHVIQAPFTPETLRTSASANRFVFAPLKQVLAEARRFPHVPSCQMKVYTRFAFPLSPLVLLLLGLPFVVAAHSKSFLKGLFFCFLLAVSYYVAFFACLDLGNRGSLSPAPAGWGPTVAFGVLGLIAFARMRT